MIIVSTAALFGAAAIGSRFIRGLDADKPEPEGAVQTLAASDSSGNNAGASAMIAIPGYDHIVMKAGQKVQEVELGNPKQNNCYITIAIMLPDGTRLYESGLLKPGQVLTSIEISRKLEAGMYEGAILSYSCYDTEEIKELNGAKTIFNLEVKP